MYTYRERERELCSPANIKFVEGYLKLAMAIPIINLQLWKVFMRPIFVQLAISTLLECEGQRGMHINNYIYITIYYKLFFG